jgi:subtilisin family serine protease
MKKFIIPILLFVLTRTAYSKSDVIVAIIDTGADVNHPYLTKGLWTNPGESGFDQNGHNKSNNGIDDDGNGFIDDVHGWNFLAHSANLKDTHGHGTHIAGIIRSTAPDAHLMILKYYQPHAQGPALLHATASAIRYAVTMGAQIINYSGGGQGRNPEEEAAIRWAEQHGVLVVAAAGNEQSNSDVFPFFPADYGTSNLLSVTAVNSHNELLPTSNYGTNSVDIAAPGLNIFSTLPGGAYGRMTGTSQATAFVSGIAARILREHPSLRSAEKLIKAVIRTATPEPRLAGKIRYAVCLTPNTVQQNLSLR